VRQDGSTEAKGEGLYWKYESTLKKLDSELWSLVGAAGELVSFRTRLFQRLEEDTILDDFVQSVRIAKAGYRFAYEPSAYALESASADFREEFKRKVRIAAGGWQAMTRLGFFLNPFRNFTLSWMYFSHRVLRWSLAAFALPLLLVFNALILGQSAIYPVFFIGQIAFYALAFKGYLNVRKGGEGGVGSVPFYFSMMNYAVFAGFGRWLGRSQSAVWERAQRKEG
jgi:cellulose synthase/poly-beta-1,6-N-acetylglucosamine synthase-like glycosyltransferase